MIKLLVTLDTVRPIENLTDLVAGRIYTMDGIDLAKDVTVALITDNEPEPEITKPTLEAEIYALVKRVFGIDIKDRK